MIFDRNSIKRLLTYNAVILRTLFMKRYPIMKVATNDRVTMLLLGLSNWIRSRLLWRALPPVLRRWISTSLTGRSVRQARFAELPGLALAASSFPVSVPAVPSPLIAGAGVNIFGYFRGEFGLGEGARLYSRALLDSGYPVALNDIGLDIPHGLDDRTMEAHLCADSPYGISLVFVNPDYFAQAMEAIGSARTHGRYVIACWFWELETIPEDWRAALSEVDEVMVASVFIEEAFKRFTHKPILRVPLPISMSSNSSDSGASRKDFGLASEKFVFMTSFDFNSAVARKNPFAAIKAFQSAFLGGRDDVQLLIKSSNGHRYPGEFHRLLAATVGDPRILVRDEVIDRGHVHALQRCINAYVSLHRAEGFGLGLAECMAIGKPVIATGWSGNLEFMTATNSCLVDYSLIPVAPGAYQHAEGARWAEPDIEQAVAFMRRLVDEPTYALHIGAIAAADIRSTLCPDRVARLMARRLNELSKRSSEAGQEYASP